MLIGSILGDGCLSVHKNGKNATFEIGRSFVDRDYLLWEYSLFKDFCGSAPYIKERVDPRSGVTSKVIGFRTLSGPIFTKYYNDWYLNRKKSVIPDLVLTPRILAIWVADDGCVSLRKNGILNLNLATNSFSSSEVINLIDLLNERYNECFRLVKRGNKDQYMIEASDAATRAIIKEIDPIFPDSMSRKSDIWRSLEVGLLDPNRKTFTSKNKLRQDLLEKLDLVPIKLFTVTQFIGTDTTLERKSVKRFLDKMVDQSLLTRRRNIITDSYLKK